MCCPKELEILREPNTTVVSKLHCSGFCQHLNWSSFSTRVDVVSEGQVIRFVHRDGYSAVAERMTVPPQTHPIVLYSAPRVSRQDTNAAAPVFLQKAMLFGG